MGFICAGDVFQPHGYTARALLQAKTGLLFVFEFALCLVEVKKCGVRMKFLIFV